MVPGDARSVFLIGERERFLLQGGAATVAGLIDGCRSVHDVLAASGPDLGERAALQSIHELWSLGHLVSFRRDMDDRDAAFWSGLGVNPNEASGALDASSVSLVSLGSDDVRLWVADALRQTGVRVAESGGLCVVVTADYLHPDLASFDQESRRRGRRWVLVKPTGVRPLVGPLFEPQGGPCWECLAFWLRANRPVEEFVRRNRGSGSSFLAPAAGTEASVRVACGLAALAVARLVVGDVGAPALSSHLLALDLASFQITPHAVVKRPQCPGCGDPGVTARMSERPIELQPIAKSAVEDGGYRQHTPQRTFARYRHLISPITGPVAYLVPVPERSSGLRAVYASGYLVCPRSGSPETNVFDKMCAGKGRTPDQARTSALCEAIERFSGVYQGDEAFVRASRRELGPSAVAPGDLLNFSPAQYRMREELNRAARDGREWIPEPLDDATVIEWAPAWCLTRNERRHVPLAYCYAEVPRESGAAYCRPCGNGVAAGTCLEEALLQGLLELVERDAIAIWWYNEIRRPAVDLESFRDPYFVDLVAEYVSAGWTTWVLDLTHDLRIPTFAALAHHRAEDRFVIGFGCHLDPRVAVQRALTEMNQLFDPSGRERAPWDLARLASRDYLFPDPDQPRVTVHTHPRVCGSDLRADIQLCMERLAAAGLELIALDKTRPDIGLAVVQVFVPGLRHFWPRFGPGRLYDVPVALGWTSVRRSEEELNGVPLFV